MSAIVHGFAQTVDAYRARKLRLVLIGAGAERSALELLCRNLGVGTKVEFRDPVPKAMIPQLAAQADCLVMNLLDLGIYRYGISLNKLFDYMAARRPIVIACNAVNNPVRDAGGGVCVAADDGQAIAEGMAEVLDASNAQRSRWGRNAQEYVAKHFDYTVLGGRLDEVLNQVLATEVPR